MRLLTPLTAALLLSAGGALAAPASVSVAVDAKLQKTFDKTYGEREAQLLTSDLQASVEKALAKSGAYDGARIELTLTDVKPNRPTFKQMGDTPGLSMLSFGLGGATIEGRIVAADGGLGPEFIELLLAHGELGTNLAELGVGTNDRARLTGNVLEDEKILGTVHVAFGASTGIGGTVSVPIHLDVVVVDASLEVDGRPVLDNGRYVLG